MRPEPPRYFRQGWIENQEDGDSEGFAERTVSGQNLCTRARKLRIPASQDMSDFALAQREYLASSKKLACENENVEIRMADIVSSGLASRHVNHVRRYEDHVKSDMIHGQFESLTTIAPFSIVLHLVKILGL